MDKERLKISTTTDGPVVPGYEDALAPAPLNPLTGQHQSYWILTEAERSLGFVRPVRRTYVHLLCGRQTKMAQEIAETYARDPKYYGSTFCVHCKTHLPVDGFVWADGKGEKVGS